jgi:hypothetical protein
MKDLDKRRTTLDDNASIYRKRETKSEKQKFSELDFKGKVSYFNTYYLKKVIVIALVAIGLGYFIYTIIAPKPENALYVAVINYSLDDETADQLEKDFGEYLNIGEMEQVNIDTSFFLDESGDPSMTSANQIKLSTYLAAQEIDMVIAPESYFENYVGNGFFDSLESQLPTNVFATLADYLYHGTTEEDSSEKVYGIYLDHLPYYKERNVDEPHVIGLVTNSTKKENGIEFIRYIFNLNN